MDLINFSALSLLGLSIGSLPVFINEFLAGSKINRYMEIKTKIMTDMLDMVKNGIVKPEQLSDVMDVVDRELIPPKATITKDKATDNNVSGILYSLLRPMLYVFILLMFMVIVSIHLYAIVSGDQPALLERINIVYNTPFWSVIIFVINVLIGYRSSRKVPVVTSTVLDRLAKYR